LWNGGKFDPKFGNCCERRTSFCGRCSPRKEVTVCTLYGLIDLAGAIFGNRNAESLSTLGAGQGVVVFYGLAKPVRTPLIGPVQQP
jgi:hypothetical protein